MNLLRVASGVVRPRWAGTAPAPRPIVRVAFTAIVGLLLHTSAARGAEPPPLFGDSEEARALAAAQAQYEAERKSPAGAFGLELLLPGLGNFYAGENEEAALTWTGLMLGAFFLADGHGLVCEALSGRDAECKRRTFSLVQGWIFLIGSRLFGLTSAPLHVSRNNRALRARLGLDTPISFGMNPWMVGEAGGLSLSLRY